jgi:outer membrane protein assembly factor BamB
VPIVTHLQNPLELERPIRSEIIQRAYTDQPSQTLEFVRVLRLFDQQRYSPLVDWAEALASRELPPGETRASVARFKDGWREPLIEDLSKEAYNALTELQAVLESEAWSEAARLITSADAEAAPGVAPYLADRRLMTSLPVAVRLVLDDYPQVREALGDRFGPLAQLRVGQAIATADAATVEMATVQFAGTEAAGEAHQWLGDRALASGWFERAIVEYRRAAAALPSLGSQVEPRIRLAAAMLGRDEGLPIQQPVRFNELTMTAAEFESLIAEMKARGNTATLPSAGSMDAPVAVPTAKRYEAHVRSRLDGPVGERPQEEVGERRTNQFRVPWADRQIATVTDGDVMYVSNHFQVSAYNLASGQRIWQSQPPPGQMQRSQDWALIPMRPLVTASRIYVRMLYSPNPLLVCLERSSGKLLWAVEAPAREFFVSDPVIVQGQLAAITVSVQLEQQGILRWNVLDPETGELQNQRDLVRLRNTWGKRACCELAALEDSVVASLGGVTLAIDPAGKVRWVRKHVTVPTEEDPRWVLQRYDRPLVAGGRIYISQPGVRTIDCLDPATGREHWSVVSPEVVGMIGLSAGRLIVRTERDVRALDGATGETLWRYDAPELHSFQLADAHFVLLAARERNPVKNDQWLTRLVWLDATSGQPTATCILQALADGDPRLGPLVPHKDRIFTFFGRGQHDPTRDVVELVPAGESDRPVPPAVAGDPWRQRVPPRLTTAAFQVVPDWQLSSGGEDRDRTGLVPDVHGEKDVLGVRSLGAATPILLAREITLPAMGRPRLRLRLATDAGQSWKLEARHGQHVLRSEEIKDQTHPDRWKTIEIDLSPAAGQSGWLTVRVQSTGGDHVLWLKSAEVLF